MLQEADDRQRGHMESGAACPMPCGRYGYGLGGQGRDMKRANEGAGRGEGSRYTCRGWRLGKG